MEKKTIVNELYNYLEDVCGYNKPILLTQIYDAFPSIKQGTIREYIRRFIANEKLIKIKNGVYGLPDPGRVLKKPAINFDEAINKKYIVDNEGLTIGYRSGFYIANVLRLTTQTPSILVIYSNAVSRKKRIIKIKNSKIIINQSRVIVSNENYKLLQVLDILNNFDKFSEFPLESTKNIFAKHLDGLELTKNEIEKIVDAYPKDAQINFYKLGVINEIT